MERGCKIENRYILFDMLRVAIWMAGKGKEDQRDERRREEGKMTGTSFLTGKSLVDG